MPVQTATEYSPTKITHYPRPASLSSPSVSSYLYSREPPKEKAHTPHTSSIMAANNGPHKSDPEAQDAFAKGGTAALVAHAQNKLDKWSATR